MSIKVECPNCSKTIKAPDKFAGQKAKCPGCGNVRPATFRTRPVKYLLVCVLTFGGCILALVGEDPTTGNSLPVLWVIPVLGVLILVKWHLKEFTTSLRITNKRSILRHGIFSKRTREVRHSDVRLLQVDQSVTQRMLGVGTLAIASAGHGEVEIMVSGIKNPDHVKETIDGYRP